MSKKPTPSKKQAVSSTRSRHSKWAQKLRKKLENKIALEKCKNCGEKKLRHFVCRECGFYNEKKILAPKIEIEKKAPIQEIAA